MGKIIPFNGIHFNVDAHAGQSFKDFEAQCMQFRFFKEVLEPRRSELIKEAYSLVVGTKQEKQRKSILDESKEG